MRTVLILAGFLAAVGLTAAMPSRAAEPPKVPPQATVKMKTDLTGDPSREVQVINVLFVADADSGRHIHFGDQYTTVLEGELHVMVDGSGDHVLKTGDVFHIDPKVVHQTRNLSGKPARTLEVFIVEKGKPLTNPVE